MTLEEVLETNQRLNRRCQQLEAEIAKRDRADQHYLNQFRHSTARAHTYANRLRDEWRELKGSRADFYRQHWERLPKPPGGIDGIGPRVDYALQLLREIA